MTAPNYVININKANLTKQITWTLRLTYNPFQFNKDNRAAKQYKVTFKLQLSGQTSKFVQDSSKMEAHIGLYKWGLY